MSRFTFIVRLMCTLLLSACGVAGIPSTPSQVVISDELATATAVAQAVQALFARTQAATLVITPSADQDPAQVMRMWMEAYWQNDAATVIKYTCSQFRAGIKEDTQLMGLLQFGLNDVLGEFLSKAELKFDGSDITYQIVNQQDREATVSITGELLMSAMGNVETVRFDEQVRMIYVDDGWQWCGTYSQ